MIADCEQCTNLKKAVPVEHITHTDPGHHRVECPNIVEECTHRG